MYFSLMPSVKDPKGPLARECHGAGARLCGLSGIDRCRDNRDPQPEVLHSLPASTQLAFARAVRGILSRLDELEPLHVHLSNVRTWIQLFSLYRVLPKKPRKDSSSGN